MRAEQAANIVQVDSSQDTHVWVRRVVERGSSVAGQEVAQTGGAKPGNRRVLEMRLFLVARAMYLAPLLECVDQGFDACRVELRAGLFAEFLKGDLLRQR